MATNKIRSRFALTVAIGLGLRRVVFSGDASKHFDNFFDAHSALAAQREGLSRLLSPEQMMTLDVTPIECTVDGLPINERIEDPDAFTFGRAHLEQQKVTSAEYYGQFVNAAIVEAVTNVIYPDQLRKCSHYDFTEIPISLWEQAAHPIIHIIRGNAAMRKACERMEQPLTTAFGIKVAKEVGRRIKTREVL